MKMKMAMKATWALTALMLRATVSPASLTTVLLKPTVTNDGHEELADHHAESAPDEQRPTTKLLDGVERDRSRAHIDDGEDHGRQEGVRDGTRRLEEGSRVVEDEVDTRPLLHHLKRRAEDGAAKVAVRVPDAALEAVKPARVPRPGRHGALLDLCVGDDLGELNLDEFRVAGLAAQADEDGARLLNVAALDKVARTVGEEEEAAAQNEAPRKLDPDGDAVRCGGVS